MEGALVSPVWCDRTGRGSPRAQRGSQAPAPGTPGRLPTRSSGSTGHAPSKRKHMTAVKQIGRGPGRETRPAAGGDLGYTTSRARTRTGAASHC